MPGGIQGGNEAGLLIRSNSAEIGFEVLVASELTK